jgi:ribosomal protein S18 acetylase RimI-like enzyme
MTDPPESTPDGLTVTICDTRDSLTLASEVFNKYRAHYGEPSTEDSRTLDWLTETVVTQKFIVYVATTADGEAVGLATSHEIPASLTMRKTWQLRDLYVVPERRRRGIGRALVLAVRGAAEDDGAIRLSLVTEPDNVGALALYESLGFKTVDGLASLSLDLR